MIRKIVFTGLTMLAAWAQGKSPDIYVWEHAPQAGKAEEHVRAQMSAIKARGVKGVFYHSNFREMEQIRLAAGIASQLGLEFHAWVPTLTQVGNPVVKDGWYSVSREGHSVKDKPPYVPYYQFLCPNSEEVYQYLSQSFQQVARIAGVAGVQLDYIRHPDVILARGLWAKYGLDMKGEAAPYDYCYCARCAEKYKARSGVDIRSKGDEAQHIASWKQFRYASLTRLVNRLADDVHRTGSRISAAVFPGPTLAKTMVRQDWGKWHLDMVAPMLYNDFYLQPPSWIAEQTQEGLHAKRAETRFICGLFICGQPEKKEQFKDPEAWGLTPSELETAARAAVKQGVDGIALFTFSSMTDAHWEALHKVLDES